jgi:hypothetical protein
MTSEFLSFWTRTVPWANHRVVRGSGVMAFIDITGPLASFGSPIRAPRG